MVSGAFSSLGSRAQTEHGSICWSLIFPKTGSQSPIKSGQVARIML
jgi:hypothetical protein